MGLSFRVDARMVRKADHGRHQVRGYDRGKGPTDTAAQCCRRGVLEEHMLLLASRKSKK